MAVKIERFKLLRQERGWSQRELARRCGFGDSLIRKYESGDSDPSASYLAIIADQFGVSVDYLLGRSDDSGGQTITIVNQLTDDERNLVDTLRNDGWRGVVRLGADRLAGKTD